MRGNGRNSGLVATDFFSLGWYKSNGVDGGIFKTGENDVGCGWDTRKRVDHRGITIHCEHETAEHVRSLQGELAERDAVEGRNGEIKFQHSRDLRALGFLHETEASD